MASKGDDTHNPFDKPAQPSRNEDPFDPKYRRPRKSTVDPFSPSTEDVEGDLDDELGDGDGGGTRDV